MARPKKDTVDYFPHYCVHKSTMFIIEQRYGNDGYAFWFKLLEILGSTDGHFLDCNDGMKWEFLQAKTRTSESFCSEILNLLCRLGAIDLELWKKRVIWSQNFIDGIAEVYRNRRQPIPSKPDVSVLLGTKSEFLGVETPSNSDFYAQSGVETRQSRVEKSRVEETIVLTDDSRCMPIEEASNQQTFNASEKNPGISKKIKPCPYQKIVEAYHEICPMLPRVTSWNGDGKKAMGVRWKEAPERQTIEWWEAYFRRVRDSDFLTGQVKDFVANLVWLVGRKSMDKVLNGAYDNRPMSKIPERLQKNIQAGADFLKGD